MKTYGIKRKLDIASKNINQEISGTAKQGGYAAAMANEGYLGGYLDAITDVGLMLNGSHPCKRPRLWEKK